MATVTLSGGFPAGTKVEVFERLPGGQYAPQTCGGKVTDGEVGKDGSVKVTGLEDGGSYWAVASVDGVVRSRAITAKPAGAKVKKLTDDEVRDRLAQTRPPMDRLGVITTGARGTGLSDELREHTVEKSNIPEMGRPSENPDSLQLHYKQADVSGPKRSDTPLGEAQPVNPDELTPKVPQSAVPEGTPQRSDTPLGEATPIGDVPPERQEDSDGLEQLSDTPHGRTAPIRVPDYPKARQSESDLEHARRVQVGEHRERPRGKTKAAKPKAKRKGSTKASRSAAAKKAAATRKRKAKK